MTVVINGTTGISGVDGSAGTPAVQGSDTNTGVFYPAADTVAISTGGSERMRVDSSGNVGIGTSSPADNLHVVANTTSENGIRVQNLNASGQSAVQYYNNSGTQKADVWWNNNGSIFYLRTLSTDPMVFSTNNTERMRIDSSGNLLVGTTDSSQTSGNGVKIKNASGTSGVVSCVGVAGGDTYHVYSSTASTYRFYVTYGGTINATNTTITAISDQRLKENIRDLDDGLEKVLALKPRKFDWKENKGANIKDARGFIAQEFETVFPDMIEEWKDPAPEGEEPYKAINANLIPTLIKAIQEQQAIITALTARITALEAK